MRILITGATGLVGRHLCKALLEAGHSLTVVTRCQKKYDELVGLPAFILEHDLNQGVISSSVLEAIEVIIHLAGENIGGSKWTKNFKQKLHNSRVLTTQNLLDSFKPLKQKVLSTVISASGIDIYPPSDQEYHEETPTTNKSFLSHLCQEWEKSAIERAKHLNIRSIQARFGLVLSRDSKVLEEMEPFARKGLLGRISGKDFWMSWIYIEDLIRALIFCIENTQIQGPINCTSPHPCLHSDFIRTLNQSFGKKDFLPAPKTLLSLFKGDLIHSVTKSHKVIPRQLESMGFSFHFKDIASTLTSMYQDFQATLRYEGWLWFPQSIEKVFEFCTFLENVKKISPPWIKFQLNKENPLKITKDTEFGYTFCIHRLTIKTKAKIVAYKKPYFFADENIKGGFFHKWHHKHYFKTLAGGTLVTDQISYQLPKGLNLLGSFWAKSDIKKIFDYRHQKMADFLKDM